MEGVLGPGMPTMDVSLHQGFTIHTRESASSVEQSFSSRSAFLHHPHESLIGTEGPGERLLEF